ncbi:unnamed protein product [Prorocentrum cordatum]|uniref:K Homology domain-containing protein n=1 Tax=Prorocentrum cordatum TaxID=2364126 RepID=A0ABN9V455_9DINO|nr:unnamed protein product [Polarella glacialis]
MLEPARSVYDTAISSMMQGIAIGSSSSGLGGQTRGELGEASGELEVAFAQPCETPVKDVPDRIELSDQENDLVSKSHSSIKFAIPIGAIGRILERPWSELAASGATFAVDQTEVEGMVTLNGSLDAVHRAHRLIIERISADH